MKTIIRYKYSPQLKVYDQVMNSWEPYTMFIQPKKFYSNIFNTDYFGSRFTQEDKSKYSLFEQKTLKK